MPEGSLEGRFGSFTRRVDEVGLSALELLGMPYQVVDEVRQAKLDSVVWFAFTRPVLEAGGEM